MFLALEHEGGARSHLSVSVYGAHPMPRMRIVGRDATFVSTGFDPQQTALLAGSSPSDPMFGLRESPDWASLQRAPARSHADRPSAAHLAAAARS